MTGIEHYKNRQWLSISSLLAFARCPRLYFYSSGCRLRQPEEHPALSFGSAIHKALPELLSGDTATRFARAVDAFDSVWKEKEEPWKVDKLRNSYRAREMLADFYQSHLGRNSLYTIVEPPGNAPKIIDKVSDWEVPFAIDIGLDVPLVGRIDALVRHRDTGALWGLEWKTSRELSTRFLESFQNSPQILAYTLALRTYTNEHVEGIMVEGLRVSTVNAETSLAPVSVPDFKIDAFIKWARYTGNLLLECERIGDFPQHYSGCSPYPMFGSQGFDCSFSRLCGVSDWTSLKDLYAVSDERPFVLADTSLSSPDGVHKLSLPVMQGGNEGGGGL